MGWNLGFALGVRKREESDTPPLLASKPRFRRDQAFRTPSAEAGIHCLSVIRHPQECISISSQSRFMLLSGQSAEVPENKT